MWKVEKVGDWREGGPGKRSFTDWEYHVVTLHLVGRERAGHLVSSLGIKHPQKKLATSRKETTMMSFGEKYSSRTVHEERLFYPESEEKNASTA